VVKLCRLAFVKGVKKKDKEFLVDLFKHLEDAKGGHGNGIGGWVKGEPLVIKGVEKTVEELVEKAVKTKWDNGAFLFHTRIKTVAPKTDENCQPFNNGEQILCHNGTTTSDLSIFKPLLIPYVIRRGGEISDSEATSYLVSLYGFGVLNMGAPINTNFTGVFLSLRKDGILEVYKTSTTRDLDVAQIGDMTIIASEFTDDIIDKYVVKAVPGSELLSDWEILANIDKYEKAKRTVKYTSTYTYKSNPRESWRTYQKRSGKLSRTSTSLVKKSLKGQLTNLIILATCNRRGG